MAVVDREGLAWLSGLRRVVELPRAAVGSDGVVEPDPFGAQRFAALVASFHGRRDPVVWGWHRSTGGGPVSLLVSDTTLAPPSSRFADATPVASSVVETGAWVTVEGAHDGLVESDEVETQMHRRRGVAKPSVESGLLAVWEGAFTVLVEAEPVRHKDIEDVLEQTVADTRYAKQRAENNPDREVEFKRLQAWHRELKQGESTGLWRVRVSAGAASIEEARLVAGLTVASFDTASTGYTLVPATTTDATVPAGFLAGTGLVASLTRPPVSEVPGLRLVLPSEFDVTAETTNHTDGIGIGQILDRERRPAGPFTLSLDSLNRHTFVCGATGSGKSQTTRHLLEEAMKQEINCLVVEPAKSEYAHGLAARLPGFEVIRIRPGDPQSVATGIDPLRPAEGFPLQTHVDLVKALFLAAFEADEPFPQVLEAALTRAYEKQGWDLALSEPIHKDKNPRYPTLRDLQQAAREVVDEIGYGPEVQDNIRGFIKVRLSSLRLGTTGRFLEGGHPLDIARLLQSNVVLEIEDVGDDHSKAFLMGVVLIAITEHHRVRMKDHRRPTTLRHLTVFEEAHRLLRNSEGRGASRQAVEMFAALLAEVRAYGEGIVIAEQIPAKLVPDVIKNTSIKIVHRLPAKDDREAVGATMNLTDNQSKYLVTVPPGTAGCFTDGMDQPVLVTMPDGTHTEQTARADPAGAGALAGHALGRCGADHGRDLHDRTVEDLARGRRAIDTEPLLRWWAELAVVAHITGRPTPLAGRDLHQALQTFDANVTTCTIVLAVDDAVAARSSLIVDRMSPADLATHVAAELREMVRGGKPCEIVDDRWLAAAFRWELIWGTLTRHQDAHQDGSCDARHPLSGKWREALGIRIPGRTCVDQALTVQQWRTAAQTDGVLQELAFGTDRPTALETATGTTRTAPEWAAVAGRYLEQLGADWAASLLIPSPAEAESAPS